MSNNYRGHNAKNPFSSNNILRSCGYNFTKFGFHLSLEQNCKNQILQNVYPAPWHWLTVPHHCNKLKLEIMMHHCSAQTRDH